MNAAQPSTFAWEPFTPRGVAAFAHAPFGRLLVTQFAVALLAAVSAGWFFEEGVFPVIKAAVQSLPADGEIRDGKLRWNGGAASLLAEGRCLALDVDLEHSGKIMSTADVQVEFGGEDVWISALPGYMDFPYPQREIISFNRPELEPMWGAWRAEILVLAMAATLIGLPVVWWLLALIYLPPAWLAGFFINRDLNFFRSWKLSCAALLPGALLLSAGLWLYGFGAATLVQFGFIFAGHFVLGWIYLFVSLLFVPGIPGATPKGNPFATEN